MPMSDEQPTIRRVHCSKCGFRWPTTDRQPGGCPKCRSWWTGFD